MSAVDRAGICVKPQHVSVDLDSANTAAAREACNKVLESKLFTFVGDHLAKSAKSQVERIWYKEYIHH